MSIGYACLALGVYHSDYRTIRLDNYSEEKLKELIIYNLESLDRIINYNIENEIYLFRISSDIIPFASSPINTIKWWEIYKDQFLSIGNKIKNHKLRVSMHPGQYTVLNSPKEEVVKRSVDDLIYHALLLDCLGVNESSKVVLHIGGVYGNKKEAINRFIDNFHKLPNLVKKRLIIENDDKNYNIEEVVSISKQISIPVVFDNLHHAINPPTNKMTDNDWIKICNTTWKLYDGKQKVHYSQQDPIKQVGSHSFTIQQDVFLNWYQSVKQNDIDVMLEVKDKNISAIKISQCVNNNLSISSLEKSWSKYKYKVLEHSPALYEEIKGLLKEKNKPLVLDFYNLIEISLKQDLLFENQINAILHVISHFKDLEKEIFLKRLEKVKNGSLSVKAMKNYIYNLAVKMQDDYLMSSYYFAF